MYCWHLIYHFVMLKLKVISLDYNYYVLYHITMGITDLLENKSIGRLGYGT